MAPGQTHGPAADLRPLLQMHLVQLPLDPPRQHRMALQSLAPNLPLLPRRYAKATFSVCALGSPEFVLPQVVFKGVWSYPVCHIRWTSTSVCLYVSRVIFQSKFWAAVSKAVASSCSHQRSILQLYMTTHQRQRACILIYTWHHISGKPPLVSPDAPDASQV